MAEEVVQNKVTEITINTRKLSVKCKSHRKASGAVKNLKRFIQKQWNTDLPVYISTDLNKKIWEKGNFRAVGKIRIRVEKGKCLKNPELDCLKVILVEVSSFRNLKDQVVMDEE
ncbi:RPL31 [Ecytonucleospora hepatopenaei]|uniref:RPL31 n=1 Tax=Ecytonucleospora hepatopenaei TaxID=646526 RepID=A0A1W0E510_9MICR|nr:RPL31 [Ecytonucleospora hepatopenaei]